MGSVKLLAAVGIGGIWTFGSYSYSVDGIEVIGTKYVIEMATQQHVMYKGIQFNSLADIEIRYRTRTVTQDYDGDGNFYKVRSVGFGAYGSYKYTDGTNDVLATGVPEFVDGGTASYLGSKYTITWRSDYEIIASQKQVSVEYKNSNGTWVLLDGTGGYKRTDTTTSTSHEERSITIESFGITDSIVAFGENYHLVLDIENVYDYPITMAMVNGVEYNLIHRGEIINTDQYVLQFTNNVVNSSVVELISSKTIEELYINDKWLDIEDITAEHILRTIDNTGYENQISRLQEIIDSMTSELNNILKEKETAQLNIDIINNQIEQGNIAIDNLEKSKYSLQVQVANLTNEMNLLTSEKNTAQLLLDEVNNKIAMGESNLLELEQEQVELQLLLDSMQTELTRISSERDNAQLELNSLNIQIEQTTTNLELLIQNETDLQTKIIDKTIQLEQLIDELEDTQATIDSKIDAIAKLNAELETAQLALDLINQKIESGEGNLIELEQSKIELESQVDSLTNELDKLGAAIENEQEILDSKLEEKAQLNNELDGIYTTFEFISQQITESTERLVLLSESEIALEEQINEMSKLLVELNYQQVTEQGSLDSINEQIKKASNDLHLLDDEKSDLDKEIREKTLNLSELYFEQEIVQSDLNDMKQLIEENINNLNELNEIRIEKELLIENLSIISISLREDLESHEQYIEYKQTELAQYEKQKEDLIKEIEELEARRLSEIPWYKKALNSIISIPSKVLESIFG